MGGGQRWIRVQPEDGRQWGRDRECRRQEVNVNGGCKREQRQKAKEMRHWNRRMMRSPSTLVVGADCQPIVKGTAKETAMQHNHPSPV